MTSYLLLARHGKAESGSDDFTRRLTKEGHDHVLRVASHLKRAGIRVDVIEHSGLTRAAETAEVFAQMLDAPAFRGEGLTADADPAPLAQRLLAGDDQRIMLVSHAPLLPRLASYLLVGDEGHELLHLGTGTVACLSLDAGSWRVEWMVSPAIAV